MKKAFFTSVLILSMVMAYAQQATELDPKFVKLPRYTNLAAIQAAITTPTQGMQVYNIATASNWYYNGAVWVNTLGAVAAPLTLSRTTSGVIGDCTICAERITNGDPLNPDVDGGVAVQGTASGSQPEFGIHGAGIKGVGSGYNYGVEGYSDIYVGVKGGSNTGTGGYFSGTTALETSGGLKFGGSNVGTPAAGKVLTATDANGNATWQNPTFTIPYSQASNASSNDLFVIEKTNSSFSGANSAIKGEFSGLVHIVPFGYPKETGHGVIGVFSGTGAGADDSSSGVLGIGNNKASGVKGLSDGHSFSIGVYGVSDLGRGVSGISTSGFGGYFESFSGYALITGTGNVGIGTSTPTAKLEVAGYSKLGDDATAPKIKIKKITDVGPAINGNKPIAHGIADASKILSIQIFMEYGATPSSTKTIPPNYTLISGYEYQFEIDGANILISNKSGNSANIGNKNFRMLITYEQ